MTTKKNPPTEKEIYGPAKLTKSREEFSEKIKDRIKIGNELISKDINDAQTFADFKNNYDKWDSWNQEYLKNAFTYQDNQYYEEYSRWGVFIMSYREKSLYEEIQDKKDDFQTRIKRLDIILDKTELIPVETTIIQTSESSGQKNINLVLELMKGFHEFAKEIRYRHIQRETISISDEYDVQDILRSLLKIFFNDVRAEDYSPSSAGGNSRIDLVLPKEKIIIETKMSSEKLMDKLLGEQIAIDLVRYENHPSYQTLIVFIYDKGDFIRNKRSLISDIERQSKNGKQIYVIIVPE